MAEKKKLIITKWDGGENFDGRRNISFKYECPRCGGDNFCYFKTGWLKEKDGAANYCTYCDDIVIFKIVNNRIEGEQLKGEEDNIQLTADDVTKFYSWISEMCEEEEDMDFDELLKDFKFDKAEFDKSSLESLSPEKIFALYENMVYMVLNGLIGGDFETMYDILIGNIGLNPKIVNELLSF